jgi:hypothetical protein
MEDTIYEDLEIYFWCMEEFGQDLLEAANELEPYRSNLQIFPYPF